MKRLVLHVGTMKTGTTAIQAFLAQNEALLAEQGVCYPTDFGKFANANPNRNGNFLMRAVCGRAIPGFESGHLKKHVPAAIEKFRRHVAEYDTVVLSEETLWRCGILHEGYWESLLELVRECGVDEVDAIVYLRRQDEYAESRWAQFVKGHVDFTMTFEEYCADEDYMAPNDYERGLGLLAGAFGREHVTVRVYDRASFVDHDIVRDFLACAGIEDDPRFDREVRGSRRTNESLSQDYTELKRLANMSPAYQKGGSNFYRYVAVAAMGGLDGDQGRWHMGAAERERFMERYEEGNAAVAREYLGREDGVLFADKATAAGGRDDGWKRDTGTELEEAVVFFAEALARERQARQKLEKRVAALERAQKTAGGQGLAARLRRHFRRR